MKLVSHVYKLELKNKYIKKKYLSKERDNTTLKETVFHYC